MPQQSRNDVGGELIFDLDNSIAQLQLALFQPLHLQKVGSRGVMQSFDGGIEIAMLLAQASQLRPQFAIVLLLHPCRRLDGRVNDLLSPLTGMAGRRHRPLYNHKILYSHDFRGLPSTERLRPITLSDRSGALKKR